MKTIFFIRHAKSSWDNPYLDDFDRPLNNRGIRNAPFIADVWSDFLDKNNLTIDLIISSPAVRSQHTTEIFASAIDFDIEEIRWDQHLYESSWATIAELIHFLSDTIQTCAIVGHNDELTMTVNHLATQFVTDNIPTSGVVGLSFEVSAWLDIIENSGKLIFYEYPKKHDE